MEGYRDRQFFLEPQQTFHRQYEALRAVFVEGQPPQLVAVRFGYKVSTLQSMVSRFRAARRCSATPPPFSPGRPRTTLRGLVGPMSPRCGRT